MRALKLSAWRNHFGFTLVEMIMTVLIFGIVLAVVNRVFFGTNDTYTKTSQRAGMGMNARLGLAMMSNDFRSAGCDPNGIGVVGIVIADDDSVRIRADLDGDGTIETTEPSEDVLYFFDPGTGSVFRNPGAGAQLLVPNVTVMTLTYLDVNNNVLGPPPLSATEAALVRSIGLSITLQTRRAGELTLNTTVALRNT
jgi:prepilin-type N-terminal cleavage/methylation domain-containing protein